MVSIDFVTVGNPGNWADGSGYGSVGYAYRISKNETTISQYAEFLNAVAKSDPYGLYNPSMGNVTIIAGITRSGDSGSYTYAVVAGSGNKPITYVSWFDAARFCNWLHNGQGTGSTETGAYTLNGTGSEIILKNAAAQVWIPSEDEWYKAAYYDPYKMAYYGGGGGYFLYPTHSDNLTSNTIGDFTAANYWAGRYVGYPGMALTDVGAYGANSASYYGTNDQGGNVWEWNDAVISGSSRGMRGGSWANASFDYGYGTPGLTSAFRKNYGPQVEDATSGFRVAGVPAPIPSVATGAASEVTGVSAILQGAVNPNGFTTVAQFEYGPTLSYGSMASATLSPDNGLSVQTVSVSISGLQPRQIYHYRLTATNNGGTSMGEDMTFLTCNVLTITALHGTVPGAGGYVQNSTATLTAIPDAGYVFSKWTGDATGKANPLSLLMDSNKTITAVFGPDPRDPDSDALTNYQEIVVYGTNPDVGDTDGDGFLDGYEVQTGHSALNLTDNPPLVAEARTAIEFTFPSALGKTYRIEDSPDLATWATVESGIAGNGGVIQRFYSTRNVARRYFRVEEEATP
ncbi:MAG: SUMF1/EgtB/PvdO family nonheme iron enzyme [Verrucomicrobia bacterium]|nr:SUMF1/EgtB/PvdO family nonheme iron enzyme [Verrucomicrobiota bacterium]